MTLGHGVPVCAICCTMGPYQSVCIVGSGVLTCSKYVVSGDTVTLDFLSGHRFRESGIISYSK